MMAGVEDEAQRALTAQELADASAMGFSVTTCRVCKRPTLWRKGPHNAQPAICGRRKCMETPL